MTERPVACYSFSAAALRAFANRWDAADSFAAWADFADAAGAMMLPFIVKPSAYETVPFEELGIRRTPLGEMSARPGEMWVLFCFRPGCRVASASPLRSDGFALVLEWRKGRSDSPLLSAAFHRLAERVRLQLRVVGYGLHPAFDRYADRVDFTDSELFSDGEHVGNVSSAWGALAAGLYCVREGRHPGEWPFPTVSWDADRRCVAGVAGLREKASVAADCSAATLVVAEPQVRALASALRTCGGVAAGLKPVGIGVSLPLERAVDEIAFGVRRRRRRRCLWAAAGLMALVLATGAFAWQRYAASVVRARDRLRASASRLAVPNGVGASRERELAQAWGELDSVLDLPEARRTFMSLLAGRNWLVPVGVRDMPATNTAPYASQFHVSSCESGFGMFWIPCRFANGKMSFWVDRRGVWAELPEDTRLWHRGGQAWHGVESLRVSPCGLAVVLEVALPVRRLAAVDPFSGADLWSSPLDGRISAFCFSNDGTRFAFATEDGCLRVWELLTGRPAAEPAVVGGRPLALAFTDDDSRVLVRMPAREYICSIVTQIPDDAAENPHDTWSVPACRAILAALRGPWERAWPFGAGDGTPLGRLCDYARANPSNRTLNVLSPVMFSTRADALCETDEGRRTAGAFCPAFRRALFGTWKDEVDAITLRNFEADRMGRDCSQQDITQGLFYAFDRQALEREGSYLAFAARLYPDDPWLRQRAAVFACWTGRDGCLDRRKEEDHATLQADPANEKKDAWVKECQEDLLKRETLVHDLMAQFTSNNVTAASSMLTNVSVGISAAWTAVGAFSSRGETTLALAALAAVERRWEGDATAWAKPMRAFLLQDAERRGKPFCIIAARADSADVKASQLEVGDIVLEKPEAGSGKTKVRIQRLDPSSGAFVMREPECDVGEFFRWRALSLENF